MQGGDTSGEASPPIYYPNEVNSKSYFSKMGKDTVDPDLLSCETRLEQVKGKSWDTCTLSAHTLRLVN